MSQTESHIGRLIPVKANEDESRDDLMRKILLENGHPLLDPEGVFDKLHEWFEEVTNFKYLFHKGKYWKIEGIELDDSEDINLANMNNDGTFSYVTSFYNGGANLHEALSNLLDGEVKPVGFALVPTEEYTSLIEDSILLGKLRAAGVDNWEGFDSALKQ